MSGLANNALFKTFANFFARKTSSRLAAIGLKFEDILVQSPDVEKALTRVSEEEKVARQRRIKRAFDLSVKHKYLPHDQRMSHEEVFSFSWAPKVEEAKFERQERQILNHF